MKGFVGVIVIMLIAAMLGCSDQSSSTQQPTHSRAQLQVEVDPRIELLAALQAVSGYDDRFGLLTRFDFAYKNEVLDQFGPFADHPAVALFDSMSQNSFSFDAPVQAVLHLSAPPQLTPIADYPSEIVDRAGGRETLDRFVTLLRDFALKTDFTNFYSSHRPFYDSIIAIAEDTIGTQNYVAMLEDYYGMSQHGYHIVLAPLMHQGGFGPRVSLPDGSYDVYNITGPNAVDESGLPVFSNAENFRHIAMHEFGHSFVNPLADHHHDLVIQYDTLFEPIREAMEAHYYRNWVTCVNEHIVRAVTTRMAYINSGDKMGDKVMQNEVDRGFVYIGALTDKLKEYESNRDRYPTFADFYPTLISAFEPFLHVDVVKKFRLDEFRGTINGVTDNVTNVVLIVPTAESDAHAQEAIHDYVGKVRDAVFKGDEIIADTTALSSDLGNATLILYGTMQGNRWLAAHASEFPFTVTSDKIVADSTYAGDSLRLITAWTHPDNKARGIVIYTATRPEYVSGINSVFHGNTDYVIARGTDVIRHDNYDRTGETWTY